MTRQRVDSRATLAAHEVDKLPAAIPAYRDALLDELRHTTGHRDHYPGAAPPTITARKPLTGPCPYPVHYSDIVTRPCTNAACPERRPCDDHDRRPLATAIGGFICQLQRPCPEHDRPVTLTPTERTAARRAYLTTELEAIDQTITAIYSSARLLLDKARRAVPPEAVTVETCKATGRDGYLEPRPPHGNGWSDLGCTNPPSRGPLCDACSQREYRWRKARNLTPRADGVYSQPARDS